MKIIKNIIENRKQSKAKKRLLASGMIYTRTKLGAGVFIETKSENLAFSHEMYFPHKFTIEQLRAMADYMEAFPECSLFEDGSGEVCR